MRVTPIVCEWVLRRVRTFAEPETIKSFWRRFAARKMSENVQVFEFGLSKGMAWWSSGSETSNLLGSCNETLTIQNTEATVSAGVRVEVGAKQFTTNAVATLEAAMSKPASASPTARARLNSIPFSTLVVARSSLDTTSGEIVRPSRVLDASPAERANVNANRSQGDIKPAIVITAINNATVANQVSVTRNNLRRSKARRGQSQRP